MLAVLFVGKKFSCNAQFEVASEIEGGGIKLTLHISERGDQHIKPIGPSLATLHISINNGQPNNLAQCKELLSFIKEQVLPKTLKLVGMRGIKIEKEKNKDEGVGLLRCLWPGKPRKRVRAAQVKRKAEQIATGYSSENEICTQKAGKSSLSDNDVCHPSLALYATPRLSRPARLVREASPTSTEHDIKQNKLIAKPKAKGVLSKVSQISLERFQKADAKVVERLLGRSTLQFNSRTKSDSEISGKSGQLERKVSEVRKGVQCTAVGQNEEESDHERLKQDTVGSQCVQNHQSRCLPFLALSASRLKSLGEVGKIPLKVNKKQKDLLKEDEKVSLQRKDNLVDNEDLIGQDVICEETKEIPAAAGGTHAIYQLLENHAGKYVRDLCLEALKQARCIKEKKKTCEDSTNEIVAKDTTSMVTRNVTEVKSTLCEHDSVTSRNNQDVLSGAMRIPVVDINPMTKAQYSEAACTTGKVGREKNAERTEQANVPEVSSSQTNVPDKESKEFNYSFTIRGQRRTGTDEDMSRGGECATIFIHPPCCYMDLETRKNRLRNIPDRGKAYTATNQSNLPRDSQIFYELQNGYSRPLHLNEDGSQYFYFVTKLSTTYASHEMVRDTCCFNCSSLETIKPFLAEAHSQAPVCHGTEECPLPCIDVDHSKVEQASLQQDVSLQSNTEARNIRYTHDKTKQCVLVDNTIENVPDLIPPVNEFLNKDHVEVKDSSEMRDDRDRESGDNLLKSVKSLPSNLDENAIQKEEREETESNKDEDILFSSSEIVSLSAKDKDDAQEIEKPSSTLKSQVTFKTEETSHDVSRDVMNDTTKQQREPEAIETQTQGFNKQQTRSNTETNARRNVLYRRTISENLGAERKRWSSSEPGNEECNRSVSSPLVSKTMTSLPSSRPELSENDVVLEGLVNHHQDIYDSLAMRTQIILHVHRLWNAGRPMDAVKTCIELTGMWDDIEEVSHSAPKCYNPNTLVTRDHALFLNILLQMPISCSMWTLDLCLLLLPKLKGFITIRHHASHVEMACSVLHIILKKVTVAARRSAKGTRSKERTQMIRSCVADLKEIKERANDVIQGGKRGGKYSTEDPGSMRLVLKDLKLALGTFLNSLGTFYL